MKFLTRLKLIYHLVKLVLSSKIDIFTFIQIIHYYSIILSNNLNLMNSLDDHSKFGLANVLTKSNSIHPCNSVEDNQKSLNSMTESIRKYGLNWKTKDN